MTTYLRVATGMLLGSAMCVTALLGSGQATRGTAIPLGLFSVNLIIAIIYSLARKQG